MIFVCCAINPEGSISNAFSKLHLETYAMKIRPLHDRVIVKRLDNERKTASAS